jgi:ferrous iron transport protein A
LKATALQPGEKALIAGIEDGAISNKLMEMGCIPGTPISVEFRAPGGDPIAFNIDGYILGLRKSEANYIIVRLEGNE